MSLRRRLLIGILVLLVSAIAVTDVVTYSSLRSFLLGRLDEQTDVAQSQVFVAVWTSYRRALARKSTLAEAHPTQWLAVMGVASGATPGGSRCTAVADANPLRSRSVVLTATSQPAAPGIHGRVPFNPFGRVSPDVFEEVLAPDHQLLFDRPSGTCDPRPRLPSRLPVQAVASSRSFGAGGGPYFPNQLSFDTGSWGSSGTTYRGEAVQLPGGILVTAVALTPDSKTLASVVHIEAVVSGIVVLGAIVLALAVTGYGLRPLRHMTEIAGAIAHGDLAQRVSVRPGNGEVSRLGGALNGMLSQIEAAFGERTRTEQRLRRFVADASHELRTPLTSIRGYAELLRKGAFSDGEAQARAAERIEHEAARMGILVDDLLLLARLDQGRPLQQQPVDLRALAVEAVADMAMAYHSHPITVTAPVPVDVVGDGVRLRQVLDNLIGNAVVHTPPGTAVTVTVGRDGSTAVLHVVDEGPGLAPDQANLVFERFYRGSSARTGDGTGLGLSIVDAIARAHGGEARVVASPGSGATFEVRLPLVAR